MAGSKNICLSWQMLTGQCARELHQQKRNFMWDGPIPTLVSLPYKKGKGNYCLDLFVDVKHCLLV